MAQSIHDQWPDATSEWSKVTASFQAAWVTAFTVYNVNSDYAAIVACICYLARMLEDATVMSGRMIGALAEVESDNIRGLVQNFQHLEREVFPAWRIAIRAYADAGDTHEALDRVANINSVHQTIDGELQAAIQADILQWSQAVAHEGFLREQGDEAEALARMAADTAEQAGRAAGDADTRQQAAAGIAALNATLSARIATVLQYAQSIPGLIDQRAAAGYDPTLAGRASLLTKLLDTVVAHEPLVANLVSDLAKFLVELAGIEDPIVRIAAQLVLKQVIDRLGLDTALHAMLSDLVGGILGGGQPKTVTDIMADIGKRLSALEEGQAELAPLAPEADQLHELGTLLFDAGLLAYVAAATIAPVATADDTVIVFEPITGPLLAPIRAMLGM
jgi:hypothetical protein